MSESTDEDTEQRLREAWLAAWPQALAAWGRPTRMHAPTLHEIAPAEVSSFAWFSCVDVEVNVDLAGVRAEGLERFAVEVLAHEVGHHVLAPADLLTSARIAARVQAGLVDAPDLVALVSNLWCDMLINDRLQQAGLDMAGVWQAIGRPPSTDALMQWVLRCDEILWQLPRGTLIDPASTPDEDAALLCSRLIRAYARNPVGGAAGFATLVRTTLADQIAADAVTGASTVCEQHEPGGSVPRGLATDPSLTEPVVHPAHDARVVGDSGSTSSPTPEDDNAAEDASGQTLSPADAHAVLQALGVSVSAEEAAVAWYSEHAAAHLVPFPVREQPTPTEPLHAGLQRWEVGDDLADIDWTGTVTASPVIVPGVTTVQRETLMDSDANPRLQPVDLDLYLDSSGSMPDPQRRKAPIALAGAVLALSALRAGARVQATTWSGPQQIAGTDGFTRDADAVLRAVVAHFGGSTSFPLPLLERTHLSASRSPRRPTHIAVISDDGIVSMFEDVQPKKARFTIPPERGTAARAVRAAGAGGTLVLQASDSTAASVAAQAPGYDVYAVRTQEDFVAFCREFARRMWGRKDRHVA